MGESLMMSNEEEPTKHKRLMFSPIVNAGNILTAISMVIGITLSGAVGYATAQSSRAVLEYRMGQVEVMQGQLSETQRKLSDTMIELTKSNVRLLALQESFNRELERRRQ